MTELRQDEAFRDLLESAPDGIVIVDSGGKIVIINRQTERLFGYSRDELIGNPVEMLMPEALRELHRGHRTKYAKRPAPRPMGLGLELVGRRKDGTEFPLEISLSPAESGRRGLITAVVRDVTERQELEEERERLLVDLETEHERYRIAMDLHDGIMQSIYAVSLGLELAVEDLDASPQDSKRLLVRSIDQLHGVIRDIRSYIFDLRPREYGGDLADALGMLVSEFQENSLISSKLELEGRLPAVSRDLGVSLYNIAHEALSNIRKHAGASSVVVRLNSTDARLCLEVIDNGSGFDVYAARPEQHRGLRNMEERARAENAELEIDSSPGAGTKIRVRVSL